MEENISPRPIQNVNVHGTGHTIIVAGRDAQVTFPPTPAPQPDHTPSTGAGSMPGNAATSKRRWSRASGGKLSASTLVAVALLSALAFSSSHGTTSPPTNTVWPEGKTALCKDGRFSESHTRSGTCSSHGGVVEWRLPASNPVWQHPAAAGERLATRT
ncbi:DUF3761 domain-containing protein [Longimicrobium sp.]|uniref:DUF3761 domain-containing protein n=1 Tax=Longimicrobium sp. TaxID=2029185 RepID=UPI002B81EB16|nr:DUF3761 domain-containing protein [Longimicrobium sp.]HSU15832.1 DUF3761 domain-containing protein [Longimicrobium sp.]